MKVLTKTVLTLLSLCLAASAYPATATPQVRPTANDINPVPTYARSVVPMSSPQIEKGRFVTTVEPVVPLPTTVLPGPLFTDFKPITEGEPNTNHSAVTISPILESDSAPRQSAGASAQISPTLENDSTPSGVASALTNTISAHTVGGNKAHKHGKKHSAVSEEILNAQASTVAGRVHKHKKHADSGIVVAAEDAGRVVDAAGKVIKSVNGAVKRVKHSAGNLRKAKKHGHSTAESVLAKPMKKLENNMIRAGESPEV